MTKKTKTLCFALLALMAIATKAPAQTNRNGHATISINNLNYTQKEQKKKNAGSIIGAIADALITGQTTTQQDGYKDAVRAAVVKGFFCVLIKVLTKFKYFQSTPHSHATLC